jgi:hypothetical protein
MLSNMVVNMLAILFAWAKEDGQLNGLIPHLIEGGINYSTHRWYNNFYGTWLWKSVKYEARSMYFWITICTKYQLSQQQTILFW